MQPTTWLSKAATIVGLASAFFALNAVSFDSEVDRKISHAQQLSAQQGGVILHNLRLLALRQTVESLAAEIRLEEFLHTWYTAELAREQDPGRLYQLQRQQEQSERRIVSLYDRYNETSDRLEALQAEVPGRAGPDAGVD